jgi:hypothetical protein
MQGLPALISQAFFRWYFPRFAARTFALARQDEYEADRIATALFGEQLMAATLTEIALKAQWYEREFWPGHWARAATEPQVVGPFLALQPAFARPPQTDFARSALRETLEPAQRRRRHPPPLRERLEALGCAPSLPVWSKGQALSLLADPRAGSGTSTGSGGASTPTTGASTGLVRPPARAHPGTGREAGRHSNADEMVEWADLERRLSPQADVRERYERALQRVPNHAGALRGLVLSLPPKPRAPRLERLAQLHASSAAQRWWAAQRAIELLENPDSGDYADALRLWRQRRRKAEEASAGLVGAGRYQLLQPHRAARSQRVRAGRIPGRAGALPAGDPGPGCCARTCASRGGAPTCCSWSCPPWRTPIALHCAASSSARSACLAWRGCCGRAPRPVWPTSSARAWA